MITHSRETYQPTSIMRWDRGIFNGSIGRTQIPHMTGDNGQTSININHIPQNIPHSIIVVKDPYFGFSHQKIHLTNQWTFQNLSKWSYCRYCPIEGHCFGGDIPLHNPYPLVYIVMCSLWNFQRLLLLRRAAKTAEPAVAEAALMSGAPRWC